MHDTLIQLLFVIVGAALAALYGKAQYDELTSEPIYPFFLFAVALPFLITSVAAENQFWAFLTLAAWVAFLTPVSKIINEMVVKEAGVAINFFVAGALAISLPTLSWLQVEFHQAFHTAGEVQAFHIAKQDYRWLCFMGIAFVIAQVVAYFSAERLNLLADMPPLRRSYEQHTRSSGRGQLPEQ
jgi:hypothetical protein